MVSAFHFIITSSQLDTLDDELGVRHVLFIDMSSNIH